MKKALLFSVALAGLMLGSCSSSDDLNGGGNNTGSNQSGDGYVAFNINLPTQSGSSSRAGGSENDQFRDGLTSEYDVKNATLLLFDGSDESTAKFVRGYALNTSPWTKKGPDDNVTKTSAKIVQKVDAPSTNYLALVVLNHNNVFSLGTDGKITVDGTDLAGLTLSKFMEKTNATTDKSLTESGFYMANAPLADKVGGSIAPTGATINTLVSLAGKIKATEAEASAAPADIYVERGVAKVTMATPTVTEVEGSYTDATSSTKVPFAVTSWALDNTNKSTYLVRSTDGFSSWLNLATKESVANPYRFVGSTAVAPGLYRTYFAKDPNFDTAGNTGVTFNKAADTDYSTKFGDDNPKYCFENTFDVANQIDNKTTRVLIKAKLNNGNDFYVLNGNQNTIYGYDDVIKEIKNQFLTEYAQWIENNVATPAKVGESNVTVEISDAAGEVTINKIEFTSDVTLKAASTPLNAADVVAAVSARLGSIQKYSKGESYYFVRIKHFGDDLTPWAAGKLGVGTEVYPTTNANDNWLGRYGVLRNNWYDIAVEKVVGLGSATVPKVTTTTDDELKSYIAVRINVLSWAKRTQSAILGQ
ncbi:Mfa1 family fimbria major subunit [Segatella copri]|uniref:Mfa1 family fimbria major subunit n=1 Tax=Segatella copri TaxID=165179 RepID=UPI0012925AF9|nr:Mfa1 family fimbria major subunit [Segatella copri]MQM91628.1 hypothetical protein [Segatella copri]MQM95630.1 hypothetical protein [Segatella copri]MQN04246.1 hypothetical protein [Segatella copri]MQO38051.1 hypothetical protein [Segatella copri]